MMPIAVTAHQLGKRYALWPSPWSRLVEATTGLRRHHEFTALADVSFELLRGESLGLIGENGAGKSTLLKILAGVASPTTGSARVEGRVASILELGSGFHPEFTGRQNVVLNAALLGLSQREVERFMPEILDFSELGDFIDQPVKTYSTGMAMRLGFAVATTVEPEVLIIDEALSVGDGYFQKKCMDRLLAFTARGGSLLFCSHAMYYVSAFCRRALWLRHGHVAAQGESADVIREYEAYLQAKSAEVEGRAAAARGEAAVDEVARGPARLVAVRQPAAAAGPALYRTGDPFRLDIEWESDDPRLAFHVGVGINRLDEVEVLSFSTQQAGLSPLSGRSRYAVRLEIPRLPLVKGRFTLYVFLLDAAGLHIFDRQVTRAAFEIDSPGYRFGLVEAECRWLPARAEAPAAAAALAEGR